MRTGDNSEKAEVAEMRHMGTSRSATLRLWTILGEVIFLGALAAAIATWLDLLHIGLGVLTVSLVVGFAITLRALLLQQVVINTMTMLNVTEKLEAIEELLKEK